MLRKRLFVNPGAGKWVSFGPSDLELGHYESSYQNFFGHTDSKKMSKLQTQWCLKLRETLAESC